MLCLTSSIASLASAADLSFVTDSARPGLRGAKPSVQIPPRSVPLQAGDENSDESNFALVAVTASTSLAATAVAAIGQSHRTKRQKAWRKGQASKIIRLAAEGEGDSLLSEAKAAAEAAKLQLEAAKLRAEAEEIRKKTLEDRLEARVVRLLGSKDAPGIGLSEFLTRLKETETIELTEEQGTVLANNCGLGKADPEAEAKLKQAEAFNLPNVEELKAKAAPQPIFFTPAVLGSDTFDQELTKFVDEMRETRNRERAQAERERAQAQAQEAAARAAESSGSGNDAPLGEDVNDDRGAGPRFLGAFAYFLPLAEAFKFVIPLLNYFPALGVFLAPIVIFSAILNAIPLGSLLVFIAFTFLAQWNQVPRLVRFNLEQAVLLDILLFIPGLVLGLMSASGAGNDAFVIVGSIFFFSMFAVCLYAGSTTLSGEYPDGLGPISSTTKNVIDRQTFDPGNR
eukprot:TRINITY_DN19272_c0_g3_i1.p1 TRINITY_DN19272_c0_g3~~TRINITY_DN19272_c0_g3_i1.p1  ORF type:complete len:455 (-),score=74.72 TRINITY_DN19272_c0_g3_i1:442-1806(-)